MDKMTPEDLIKKIESGYSLPSLSPVAMKLIAIALDESCTAEELSSIVDTDPSMTVRVLKMANSAFFHSSKPTTSLRQAIVRMGFQRLRIMALSLSLRDTFPMGKLGPFDYEQFWKNSLYKALISKCISEQLGEGSPDEIFISTLIMEIGFLILFDLMIRPDTEVSSIEIEPLEKLLKWERERYGIDHRQVGEVAFRCWKFPESMVQSQLLYGENALSENAPLLSRIYELSGKFSHLISHEAAGFHAPFIEAERILGLKRDAINDILMETFEQVQDIADNLNVEVNKERDLLEIMEKANKTLSEISEKMTGYDQANNKKPLPSFESLNGKEEIVQHTLQAVAHEIRNPLLAVGGFARKLATSFDSDTKGGQYAKIILEEASRLEKAISEMSSRVE